MPKIKKNESGPESMPGAGANTADDSYVWIAGAGAWGDASNWKDVTTGANPATAPPGIADSATIKGPGGSAFQIISGPGSSAALTLTGNNFLDGQFDTGSLVQRGTLIVGTESTLSAESAVLGDSSSQPGIGITEVTGATFRIGGTLAVEEPFLALNSGTVQADALTMDQFSDQYIGVDSTSVFEVGTTGTAASGALTVDSGAVLSGSGNIQATVVDNGTIIAGSGHFLPLNLHDSISGDGALEIGNRSTLETDAAIGSGINVLFDDHTGTLMTRPLFSQDETISGFSNGNAIDLLGASATNASYAPGDGGIGTLTVTNDGAPVTTLKLDGDYAGQPFFLLPDSFGNGTNIVVVCFCEGTRLSTPTGEIPVEQLAVGDRVLTLQGEARPIVWIGTGHVPASRHASDIVMVRKGALDDNVPCRDLRVTKGHSMFVDGVLVPVEFLINNRTILWGEQVREVTIYHVELTTHDVLIADGAPAESYRDDGNRRLFQNANPGWKHRPKEPCARVLTAGPTVDLIWRRLRDRANAQPGLTVTGEPDLHLVVDGRRIDAIDRSNARYVFQIAARPRSVRIRSRCAAPQALGVSKDPRMLGVAIQRIVLAHARRQRAITADAASLTKGYHAFEADFGIRWTDGDAVVPADLFAGMSTPGLLMLHIGGAAMYPDHASSSPGA